MFAARAADRLNTFNISTSWRSLRRRQALRSPSTATAPSPRRRAARTSSKRWAFRGSHARAGGAVFARTPVRIPLCAPLPSGVQTHRPGAQALRRARQRTIFNFLGPLLNPARPTAQLIGVPRPELCEPLARVLQSLGVRRGMVVSGSVPLQAASSKAHLDELSTLGENVIAEFYQDRGFHASTLSPADFPLQPATLADLAGSDRETNAKIVRRILEGEERGPKRDAVLLMPARRCLSPARRNRWSKAGSWRRR